ncbi:unnamed protein product, partial [Staurois parvus]
INGICHFGLHAPWDLSSYGTSVRSPDHVITDWPISDHMQSSKQGVTSDIITYY